MFTFSFSFLILSTKFSGNFNGDILCLDFLGCAFVGLSVSNTVGLGVGSGIDSIVG